jgi:rod shape-determining protein MreC
MESFFSRYKNPLILMLVLFIQVVGLATQVKRPEGNARAAANPGGTRLIRVWAVSMITPVERAFVGTGHFFRNTWHNYVDLHDVRKENRDLQDEVNRLRMEQVRLKEDAEQGRRLQALLGFKEKFISQTVVAQVIGSSGSEQSHLIYIDKGSHAGIKPDMAVITPDGIVGKIKDVFPLSSQVLLINDRDSGAGVILGSQRLQGVLKGSLQGEIFVKDIMSDEKVENGDPVITSGGDRIYPKGLPVGTVTNVAVDRDSEASLAIKIKPAANLNRLEEVMVITRMAEEAPTTAQDSGVRVRAADILAERLPSVPKVEDKDKDKKTPGAATPGSEQKKTPGGPTAPNKTAGATGKPSQSATAAGTAAATKKTGTTTTGKPEEATGSKPAATAKKTESKKAADTGKTRVAQPPSAVQEQTTSTTGEAPAPKKPAKPKKETPPATESAPPDNSTPPGERPPR